MLKELQRAPEIYQGENLGKQMIEKPFRQIHLRSNILFSSRRYFHPRCQVKYLKNNDKVFPCFFFP